MSTHFTVAILSHCKQCIQPIDKESNPRRRSFCSKECRDIHTNKRRYHNGGKEKSQAYQQRKASVPSADKKKCALCGRWYRRVAFHVFQTHHLTAREYKQHIDAPLSKGILTDEKRALLRSHALYYQMDKQLQQAGKNTRYTKNDPRTKGNLNKGRTFEPNDYY